MTTHVLYRIFDKDDQLLYIGITDNPAARWHAHRRKQPWWSEVATVTYAHYLTRAELEAAERAAIVAEAPLYNVVHNGRASLEGFTYLGWPRVPDEEDWTDIYSQIVEFADFTPELAAAVPLLAPVPRLTTAALDWCRAYPRTAHVYGLSKSPVLTDKGFLPWLKARGNRNDGISDVTADVLRDPALRRRRWSAQQLWAYFEDYGASSSVFDCVERATGEYRLLAVSA